MDVFSAKKIHLTGIKGVAMTSLAQCLVDMNKELTGSDVTEDFVTKEMLSDLNIPIHDISSKKLQYFIPDLLIYTSAHGGPNNPEVLWALSQNIPTLSQAEALAQLFNIKAGIAVCGVGGKSTTSAMITWILEKRETHASFSVGVGRITGLDRTGKWDEQGKYFVAEADEYVIDPKADKPIPRFSFLKPEIIVCTNIKYDHPDVYKNFEETKEAYRKFFLNVKQNGKIIINGDDEVLQKLTQSVQQTRKDIFVIKYGSNKDNDVIICDYEVKNGSSRSTLTTSTQQLTTTLSIPGIFNHFNATAAIIACEQIGTPLDKSIEALSTFQSTQRRFEFVGEKNGVKYYDDYAHHPNEVKSTIQAFHELFENQPALIAFQPHTFSRTKQLFDEFVTAFTTSANESDQIILLDIFASARESDDPSISSQKLADAIKIQKPDISIEVMATVDELAKYLKQQTEYKLVMTMGAGDIYKIYERI